MCGIVGIYSFNEKGKECNKFLQEATDCLSKRGPDAQGFFTMDNIALGHRRLSVIDTSEAANQPMFDETGRYVIIFNGEIFNYRELRKELMDKGISFQTQSDTEVLLKLFIHHGKNCLNKLNGFFVFAIYDKEEKSLFIARDRMGIKPLIYYVDEDKYIFASEHKAILKFPVKKNLDFVSLFEYLQLTYIPRANTIFKEFHRLLPGHFLILKNGKIEQEQYYEIPKVGRENYNQDSYEVQQQKLFHLLEDAIQRRLISDVPIGVFLSGGVDSSIITALAARHTKYLKTFSIGYNDAHFFDETNYANIVAKQYSTTHTVFRLSKDYIIASIFEVLENIDEPFADPSSIAVYILSKHTRKHVTVALSGDGADEIFGGYNKHFAEINARSNSISAKLIETAYPLWKIFPKSRNSFFGNKARQLSRFAEGMQLSVQERYWLWCCFMNEDKAKKMILPELNLEESHKRKKEILQYLHEDGDFNEVLYSDTKLVLPSDMLRKIDLMSMSQSLEVRVPFLDHRIIDFVFSLSPNKKINSQRRKIILQDTFKKILPPEIYHRPKQGFEVPLLDIFKNELKSFIFDDLLSEKSLKEQGIFKFEQVDKLRRKMFSNNPEDTASHIWSLMVLQSWVRKNL